MTHEYGFPMSRMDAIDLIAHVGDCAQVIECEIGGSCRDVTEDVALAIHESIYRGNMPADRNLLDFLDAAGVDISELEEDF